MSDNMFDELLQKYPKDILLELNAWPEGTKGYDDEKRMIETISNLCQEFGYGRVAQVSKQIEDLLNHKICFSDIQNMKQRRLKLFKDT